jgi:hypothetical protein
MDTVNGCEIRMVSQKTLKPGLRAAGRLYDHQDDQQNIKPVNSNILLG